MDYLLQGGSTAVLLLVIWTILKLLGVSYFSEKGKNLATKEDIGEITREIESIKNGFEKEVRIIGANLDLMRSNTEKRMDAEGQVLIAFFEKYYLYIETISSASYLLSMDFTEEKANGLETQIETEYKNIKIAFALLQLYISDTEIIESAVNLQRNAFYYYQNNDAFIMDLRRITIEKNYTILDDNEERKKKSKILDSQLVERVRINLEVSKELDSKIKKDSDIFCSLFRKYISRNTILISK